MGNTEAEKKKAEKTRHNLYLIDEALHRYGPRRAHALASRIVGVEYGARSIPPEIKRYQQVLYGIHQRNQGRTSTDIEELQEI